MASNFIKYKKDIYINLVNSSEADKRCVLQNLCNTVISIVNNTIPRDTFSILIWLISMVDKKNLTEVFSNKTIMKEIFWKANSDNGRLRLLSLDTDIIQQLWDTLNIYDIDYIDKGTKFILAIGKVKDWDNITDQELKDITLYLTDYHAPLLDYNLLPDKYLQKVADILIEKLDTNHETFSKKCCNKLFDIMAEKLDKCNKHKCLSINTLSLEEFIELTDKYPKYLYQLPSYSVRNHKEISILNILKNKEIPKFFKTLLCVCKVCNKSNEPIPKYLERELNELVPLIKMHGYNLDTIMKSLIEPYITEQVAYVPTKVSSNKVKSIKYGLTINTPDNIQVYETMAERNAMIKQYINEGAKVITKFTITEEEI